MYETYWQLDTRPFENTSDPRFYYPDESRQAALLKLRYAVENQRQGVLLAGPAGVGKTLAVTMLRASLGDAFSPFVHVVFPRMPADQLLLYLGEQLGAARGANGCGTIAAAVQRIERALAENVQRGRHAVVVVDEAQLVDDPESLEALRMLTNFQWVGRPGVTLVLVGQPRILPVLARTPQLDERMAVKCLVRPFTPEETADYVLHRLRVAGAEGEIFEPQALQTLHQLTHGVARRINHLADLALLIGYAEGRQTITSEQIESVCQELVAVAPE
ncbi:MAG TPA: ATPase [Planctomycetaceae bacterium]|nr:ATPase [Planctomycetaceae bacterium]